MGVHVLHISDIHAVADPAALVYGREADANLRRVVDAAQTRRPRFDGSPCVMLVHHPPRPPCEHPDCRISEGQPLLDVLDRHHDVRVVLSGHLHRSFGWLRGGTCWIGAPSTCMQIEHPHHIHTAEPPAAHVMELGDDGSVLVSAFQG
jgi:hypothetical protein